MELNKYIDHTKLGPLVTKEDILKLTEEAKEYNFKTVCVAPVWVSYAKELLEGSDVLVCTVVGFPHGANTPKTKAFETKDAIKNGADEIDMVVNIAAIKERDTRLIARDIKAVVKAAGEKVVKVIIETAYLDKKEITYAAKQVVKAKATFVKTSTGFASRGATLEDVLTIKKAVGDSALIKAAGGVRSKEDALKYIEAGVSRIGTSSGVKLIKGENNENTSYWIRW